MGNVKAVSSAVFAFAMLSISSFSLGQPFWTQYGKNAQHTAYSENGVQAMNAILWQTPVDLYPVGGGNGEDVLAHYGSPLVTSQTVVVPVRTGPNSAFPSNDDTYRMEGHSLGGGVTIWTENSDFVDWMPHDWTPIFGGAIDSNGKVYYPGAGGTILMRSSADSASATVTRLCFYGLSNYESNESVYNSNVQVCTPLTVDASNNVYFGFYVTGGWSNSLSLTSGIAEITASGTGIWESAGTASGVSGQEVGTNCAPAVSNDGKYVYVAVKQQGTYSYGYPMLLRLNTSDLSTASKVSLPNIVDLGGGQHFPYILDDSSAAPTVGPDGDVYYGVWGDDLESRGWMLHYSSDLSTAKPMGGFGWDASAAIVPATCVPSYTGSSSYLILTKYNNYSDNGLYPYPGNGLNEVGVLDPNATEDYTVQYESGDGTGPTYVVMKEALTIVGPTANTGQPGVREWCINMAAIDAAGKGAVVNSEDGNCYYWSFLTNSLTKKEVLEPPTGEAYTPTVVSADGISVAINNAELFAMWDGVKPSNVSIAGSVSGGCSATGTVNLAGAATGPGATVQLSSNNANLQVPATVTVPAGSSSKTFTLTTSAVTSNQAVTITATRYGFPATTSTTITPLAMTSFTVSNSSPYMTYSVTGTVDLNGAPTANTAITAKSLDSYCTIASQPTVLAGKTSSTFTINTGALTSDVAHSTTIELTLGSITISKTISIQPITLSSIQMSSTVLHPSQSGTLTLNTTVAAGATGLPVTITCGSSYIALPTTATVLPGKSTVVVPFTTSAKAPSLSGKILITATLAGKTLTIAVTF